MMFCSVVQDWDHRDWETEPCMVVVVVVREDPFQYQSNSLYTNNTNNINSIRCLKCSTKSQSGMDILRLHTTIMVSRATEARARL